MQLEFVIVAAEALVLNEKKDNIIKAIIGNKELPIGKTNIKIKK